MDSMMKGELEPDFHRQTNYFVKPNVWIPLYIRVGNILCNINRKLFGTTDLLGPIYLENTLLKPRFKNTLFI